MSAENPIDSQFELPDELRNIERLCAGFSPTSSEVNRDTLMYQAGWAAAEVQTASQPSRFWPTVSAVLAASLLLVLINPTSLLQRGNKQAQAQLPITIGQSENEVDSAVPTTRFESVYSATVRKYPPQASLLAMRERALRFEFDEPGADYVATEHFDEVPMTPSTNRELLREFLPVEPAESVPQTNPRPWWSIFRAGESV